MPILNMKKIKQLNEPGQERFLWESWAAVFPLGNRWVGLLQKNNVTKRVCGHLHRSEFRACECVRRKFPEADYVAS